MRNSAFKLGPVQAYYDEFFPVRSMAAANMAFLLQAQQMDRAFAVGLL